MKISHSKNKVDKKITWDIGINTDGLMDGVTGRVGNFVFRTLNQITIVSRRPRKPTSESAGQRDNRDRFRLATAFAKRELLDPEKRKYYERLLKKKPKLRNAYTAAIKTFMNMQETVVRTARMAHEKQASRKIVVRRKLDLRRIRPADRIPVSHGVIRRLENKSTRDYNSRFNSNRNNDKNLWHRYDNRHYVQALGP